MSEQEWQPMGIEWRLYIINETLKRIANALESKSNMEEARLHPSSGMLPGLDYDKGGPWGAKGTTDTPKEGYATRIEWNDYTKSGLSSADSREGDNLPPYQPVDFMAFSTVGFPMKEVQAKIFGNACEDDECQK